MPGPYPFGALDDRRPPVAGPLSGLRQHETVVGVVEIAHRLQVPCTTVDQWRHRGHLPGASWVVGGRPAWNWAVVDAWAKRTHRVPAA
jgi:hypothetical protein